MTVDSFFFGSGAQRLYGTYHPPAATVAARPRGLLLIPALSHEYVQCHFAYRMLAGRMSEAGFPVLRFEYRGCGNAAGSYRAVGLEDWLADIERAIEELARLSGAAAVTLGGIRFGAALAALAAGASPAADAALLWNPVIDGVAYVAELKERHAGFLRRLPRGGVDPEAGVRDESDGTEIIGFMLGTGLLRDIESVTSAGLGRALATRQVLLLEDGETPADAAQRQALGARAGRLAQVRQPPSQRWLDEPHHVFLPGRAIGEITAWMTTLS